MIVTRVGRIAILAAGLALTAQAAEPSKKQAAADKKGQPDIKFLEYLGAMEGDQDNWTDIAASALADAKRKGDARAEDAAKSAVEKR